MSSEKGDNYSNSEGSYLLLPCLPPCRSRALAEGFTGKVVGVFDNDTIDVLRSGRAERMRLRGIDCPERRQDFGAKAKQFTSDLAFGRRVTV